MRLLKWLLLVLFFLSIEIVFAENDSVAQRAVAISNSSYVVCYEYCSYEKPVTIYLKRHNDSFQEVSKTFDVSPFENVGVVVVVKAKVTVYEISNATTNQVCEAFNGYYVVGTDCLNYSKNDTELALNHPRKQPNTDINFASVATGK